jgi:hypothetical protein
MAHHPDGVIVGAIRSADQAELAVDGERAGGPTVTAAEVMAVSGRSRRRAYELLHDARAEEG